MDTLSGGAAAVSHIASQTSEASIKLLLQVSKGLRLTAIHPIPPKALFMWKAEENGESQKRWNSRIQTLLLWLEAIRNTEWHRLPFSWSRSAVETETENLS